MLPVFRSRKDRLKPYMEKQLADMLFVEMPVDALTDEADLSFMKGVPLPIKKEDLADLSGSYALKHCFLIGKQVPCKIQFVLAVV